MWKSNQMSILSYRRRTADERNNEPTLDDRCSDCDWQADLDHGEWNYGARGETEVQRMDRNFLELLQELRVAQTGVQILFAFMLGLAFTPRFTELDSLQQAIYVVTLTLTAASAAVLIAPVMYHRLVFRRRLKPQLVRMTHRFAVIGLCLLLLSVVGSVEVATSLVLDMWATALASAVAGLFVMLWFVVPIYERGKHSHHVAL